MTRNMIVVVMAGFAFIAGVVFMLASESSISAEEVSADLTRSDIVKLIANVDHDGLILRGVNLSRLNLSSLDFRGADLSFADLTDVDLSGAELGDTILESTNLENANLQGVTVTDDFVTFTDVVLPDGTVSSDPSDLDPFTDF